MSVVPNSPGILLSPTKPPRSLIFPTYHPYSYPGPTKSYVISTNYCYTSKRLSVSTRFQVVPPSNNSYARHVLGLSQVDYSTRAEGTVAALFILWVLLRLTRTILLGNYESASCGQLLAAGGRYYALPGGLIHPATTAVLGARSRCPGWIIPTRAEGMVAGFLFAPFLCFYGNSWC